MSQKVDFTLQYYSPAERLYGVRTSPFVLSVLIVSNLLMDGFIVVPTMANVIECHRILTRQTHHKQRTTNTQHHLPCKSSTVFRKAIQK